MAKFLAREIEVTVNTETVGGLTSVGFSSSKNDADTTDFASEGQMEHIPASRSREVSLEGNWIAGDPGQAAILTSADLVGDAGTVPVTLTFPDGEDEQEEPQTKVYSFDATVNMEGPGGGNDDPATFSATLTVTGAVTRT